MGDGAYIFGTPTAAHWASRAYNLPVLFVIFNNRAWNAVKRAVDLHAPQRLGGAHRRDAAERARAVARLRDDLPGLRRPWAERVEDPAALPDALARALRPCGRRSARSLLNVICKKP